MLAGHKAKVLSSTTRWIFSTQIPLILCNLCHAWVIYDIDALFFKSRPFIFMLYITFVILVWHQVPSIWRYHQVIGALSVMTFFQQRLKMYFCVLSIFICVCLVLFVECRRQHNKADSGLSLVGLITGAAREPSFCKYQPVTVTCQRHTWWYQYPR